MKLYLWLSWNSESNFIDTTEEKGRTIVERMKWNKRIGGAVILAESIAEAKELFDSRYGEVYGRIKGEPVEISLDEKGIVLYSE